MRINHNIASLNTYRQLSANTSSTSKSLEKLSSGFRINRAGDDAAGLAISEKMRGQIRGLDQATSNSQNAISLIQTAEGALNETHSILQRMRELAVQSATDTNTSADRSKIQSEVDQLAKEITRISNTTEFNTQNLLAGGLNDTFHIGANAGQNVAMSIGAMDAFSLGVADSAKSANTLVANASGLSNVSDVSRGFSAGTGFRIVVDKTAATNSAVAVESRSDSDNTQTLAITNATSFTGTADTNYIVKVASVDSTATNATNAVTSVQYSKDNGVSWTTVTAAMGGGTTIDGMTFTIANTVTNTAAQHTVGDQYSFTATAAKAVLTLEDSTQADIGVSQTVHYGDTSVTLGSDLQGKTVKAGFTFGSLADGTATFTASELKSSAAIVNEGQVNAGAVVQNGINVSNQVAASDAITTINTALEKVSAERSKLGAMQNRLEHTIANLGTSSENLTASESRVRDVDMAKEMMEFTKNNILSQAAQAMLAQANQQPQGVLQLLR